MGILLGNIIVPRIKEIAMNIDAEDFASHLKVGLRMVVNIGTVKDPEYYLGSITEMEPGKGKSSGMAHITFDDETTGIYKATRSLSGLIGIAKNKIKLIKEIPKSKINGFLKVPLGKGGREAGSKKEVIRNKPAPTKATAPSNGKGTVRKAKPFARKPLVKPEVVKKVHTPQSTQEVIHTEKPNINLRGLSGSAGKVSTLNRNVFKPSYDAHGDTKLTEALEKKYKKMSPKKLLSEYKEAFKARYLLSMELYFTKKYTDLPVEDMDKSSSEYSAEIHLLSKIMEDQEDELVAIRRKINTGKYAKKVTDELEKRFAKQISEFVPPWQR